jgi:nucleotide-binding universal stress UspA family protein
MSFQTIMVGVDLSAASEIAVGQAMSVARHVGARVVLAHVALVPQAAEGLPPSMRVTESRYREILAQRLADDRARLEALRQRLIGQGVEVSHVVVDDGFPDVSLSDAARELGADLVAIGTHGRTGLKRLLLGSVAEKVVRFATSSVLVARGAPAAEGGYRRILVGTDFSPLADRAVERAAELAGAGARIHVINAWQLPVSPPVDGADPAATLRGEISDDARARGLAMVQAWRERGVAIEVEASEAPAAEAIVERATSLGADLVVVGSHGRRGVRRLVLGSVAEATVRHAPCSVLVAR